MADTSRTTPPSVAEMEAEFAKSRATPTPDPVADLEAEYQRAKAAPNVDLESEFKASRPLDPRKEPAPIPIQAAKGLAPNKPAPDLSKAEAELQDVLIEYNTWTNHPDPKGDALAQVEARRMRRAPSDKSAKITPFATGEVAERIKAATEPGSIGYRAAEALAPKWYGPAAQTERRHYWRVAESEADRQLARVVRQQMLMDQGVPKDAATIRAQAAYELGIPLLVPTQDNPRFSAGPGVDIGVSKVTDLENTFGQGVADLAAGTMDLVSETANLAKDVAVDAPMAVAAGVARPAYEAVTGKEAPDPSKAIRDWTFGSLTNAVANALPESAAKESLRLAQERGAGMLAGSAEVRNALLTPLGVDPIDPDGDGILDVVSRLMLTQPKEEMPAPTVSGEEIVSSTVKNVASTPGIIAQGYRDILSGEREVGDVYADTMTVGSQMMTTPVMDLFASVSKAPGAQEQESSLGWFLRVPATALSGLTTTQAARIADYWLVRSGATSQRRRRVPGDPEMGFWEAHLPVIFTGNGLHDYVTTLYNGDSFTSEWMRTADTAATLPGISDALRSSLLPGGRWREGGTQLAMWADLLVPVDNLPVDVIRGTKGVVTGAGDALRARSRGMSVKESAAMGAATALPASFTHALMMSDPAYRAEWEGLAQEAEAQQRSMGVTEPVAFDPDADMVREATGRAWMRRMVDRGVNPLYTDKNTPADQRALAYSIRETLTALKVRPEDIEAALAEMMGGAEAVEPAVGSVVPSVEAERLDAREAALSDLPPIGTFTEAVTAAATPREKVIAGLEELATSWGMDPADPLVSRAFEAALSYYDPAKGAFRRVPEADEALLNRITDADATRALNRLRDASPAQVMENTRAFVLGAMPRWADERIPDRARVRSEIIGQAVVEGRPLDVKQVDAFLAVTDRIADALVARGVLPTRDAWYAKQTYTGIAPGSPDEVRGRGFIQIAADGNAIIGLARDANLGTLFHENAHLLRRILPAEHMEAVDAYVREQFGGWTVPAEEWFARQFESVLTTGKVSVAKGDTITAKFVDALNKALRFAADVLLKVYEGGGLPDVNPVFAKWMETFAGLKIEIEPVKADPPVTPPPRAKKPGQVVTREDGITIPHVTADGWGPAMLREAETRAAEALKDGDKAVQAWLSWVHAYLGEPKDIRAKRHRLAGRNAKAVVEAMLNAGRRIVSEMDDAAKATADAAFAQPAPAPALPSYAPTKKQLAAAGYKPEGKGAMVHPETGDRYGWNGEAKVWTRVEGEVVAEVAAEPAAAAPWEAPLAAMSASSSTKDILAAVAPLMDALNATKEERASFLAQVKGAIKNKMPVGPVATAFVSTKIRVPADVSPPPAPTLPDVLTPIPEPSPTPLPPTRPMPKAGTLKVDAYGQPRKLAGDIPFSIRKVKLADIATEGIPPGVEELARSFNADELDPTGVDPGVGAITVRKQDGKWVAVDGVRRAQALQELHRRGMAGEEPYRSILAGVQHRTSAWATGLGVKQPLGDEVFVRVVDRDVRGDAPATGLDVLGLLPQDLADATSRAGAVAQARIAASAAAIAAIVSNPSPTFQAVAPLAALRDGLLLYAQTRAAGGPPARWASQIRSRYVAVAGSKVLPVSAPSVHVAVALGSLSPEAFAAWLDGVAKGGPWARSEADIKATADLPTRHDEAIEHGRRLEMEAIEAAEAEQPVAVEPPGWIPEVGPKGGEKLYQPRQTDTPEFRRWFGDSKVVDEKGRPLVVYHGTAADFDAFRPGGDRPMRRGLHGTGIWFTKQPAETGSGVGGASDYAQGEGARIVPVYVSIKNPKEMGVRDAGFTSPEELEAEGYDGAHMIDSDAWVALRPTQIKSAIANVGTFDPENPSILRHHRDYTTTILPDVQPGDPIPPVPTGDVVSETVGRDQPQAFYGASKDKEGVATPYGMRAVKHRAIPAYTDPSQLKRALGYRADQTRFNARDLVVRAGAYALLQQSQARNARTRFIKVGNTVSVPVTRAAAVRARALAVLGDLPARVKKAIETRPRLAVGEDAEKQPLGLSMADAGRIRTLLNALDANGWIDALPADIAKMTVTDIAEKMTSEQFRQFHGAVLDAQSGAAPYRGRVDRYAIAANLVWEFAQVPGGWFTPVPLPRDAGWLDKKLYNARSWVGALILSTANYALAWEQSHPDMRPDIRPLYERMRREMSQLPSRLAESLEALMESKHKAATPGAMQAELEELARTLPGAVPPIGVNPRGDGDPSDMHVLRTWLFRDPPEPYGSSTSVDMDGNTVVNFVPHDFPRVGDVDPNLTSSPERPIVDLVAEVVAHEDVLNRILNPPGRRIAPEVVDLLNQARNRTLDEEGANLLYGYAHAALNAARRIGTDILTAAAGHSGSKDKIENLVDALERDGKLSGIALDAYEAFYQLRWTDPKGKGTKASIEAIVRTLGMAPKTLPAPFWVFDVLNRLNVYHLMEDFTDLALDRNYVFTLMSMTEDTGIVFKDLRDRASFAMAVKDAINAEMRGTDYVRIYGEDVKGSGEVGVNMDSGSVQSQRARYTARTIMAHMGLRPDVLAERKGYKGEMATSPVTSAWLSLPTDPAARLRAVADPQTWREAGKRYGLYGRDLFVSTVLAENLAELAERNAPLAERLAVVLSNRESYAQFFDILRDVYAQLKGSFITGGANGILAAALFGTALFGAAAVPQAAALGVAAWGLSWMPRFAGFANNSLGAVLQGVIELGFTGTAKALATGSVPAARAAYQSVRFHRSFKAVEMARTAVANIVNPRPPENVSFVAADGRVYSIADVMTISKHYGLDETQARSESAETIRRKVDRMYATYEADPSFTGQLWRVLASFFGRYKITENYRRLYEQVDVFFRYVWLVRGLQEGLRPEDAVARALRISFDYSSTSQLDRWINMIGMFWMYQRRALDLTLAAVIEHPATVFSMIRFMRAQDLTSGYADLNEEYERETETVAEYGLGRFSAGYLPVAGAKTYAQKMLLVEPPNVTAIKLMMDVTTADPFMVASRANPMIAVGFNLIGTTAGGPMVSMFRRSTAESPNQWKVPARFVMLDQALNGGKLTHLFGIVPMNVEDGTAQPSDEMAQDFYVGEQGRLLWDAYRSLVPGFSTWLTDLEVTDRSQGAMDALQIEVMNAIEGKGLGERQNYGSVFIPATDVQPRLALGADWEAARRIGIAPAPVSSPAVAEARPAFSADQAMREETEMLLGQVKRMRAETPEAKELRQPEEVQPDRKVGVDPNAPMGLERKR